MKPESLQKGKAVIFDGSLSGHKRMVYVRKIWARDRYVFLCAENRGLDGPEDQGFVTLTGRQVREQCRRAE